MATVMAMPVALFPVINDERFGGRPETLGLFLSAIAVGGMAAGVFSGAVTRSSRLGAIILASAIVWGAALTAFGLSGGLICVAGVAALAVVNKPLRRFTQ